MVCGWPLVRVGDYFCNEKEFGVLRLKVRILWGWGNMTDGKASEGRRNQGGMGSEESVSPCVATGRCA